MGEQYGAPQGVARHTPVAARLVLPTSKGRVPVVVLTSSSEQKDLVASYNLGVNSYVVKPVDFHEFVNAIKELGMFWTVVNEPPPGSVRKR